MTEDRPKEEWRNEPCDPDCCCMDAEDCRDTRFFAWFAKRPRQKAPETGERREGGRDD